MQMAVGLMLGLSFTVLNSAFCKEPWPDLEEYIADAGFEVSGAYSCSLAWGGVCVAVSVALWFLAAFMTLGKGRSDRLEEMKKEQLQSDAEALLGAQLRVSLAQLVAPVDLILVQSEAGNVGPGEFANVAHRSADAAADIQNLEVGRRRGKAKLAGQIVLVTADRFTKVLVRVTVGKVERLAPSPLVKERGEVVVRVDERLVISVALVGLVGRMQPIVLIDTAIDIGIAC